MKKYAIPAAFVIGGLLVWYLLRNKPAKPATNPVDEILDGFNPQQ